MVKQIILVLGSIGVLLLSGCATYLPNGVVYTGVKGAPVSGQVDSKVDGNKKGKACSMSILGLVAVGDMTVEKAAKDGGIEKISSVDYKTQNILGVYGKYCTIVHGS
ncbi:TRL-like family protein [Thiotrichales bacterium 19S9-12]|nr:TRL-like family protein [Thiotrichales bacterium 19S9-11]MCF6810806.1 TRL-like family protein [Thiotrichales bacterium 19S9-12]